MKKEIIICRKTAQMYICSPQKRAISSVGLEHLPYKQGVVGSNPTSPTFIIRHFASTDAWGLFYLHRNCTKNAFDVFCCLLDSLFWFAEKKHIMTNEQVKKLKQIASEAVKPFTDVDDLQVP